MRFTLNDWLWHAVLCAIAAAASRWLWGIGALLGWAMFGLAEAGVPALMALPVIDALARGIAVWIVIRHCVDDLRLTHWLLAVSIGAVLVHPFLLPMAGLDALPSSRDLLTLSGNPVHLLGRWLTLIAESVVPFLPPGLLLWRLTGAGAWPLVGLGALSVIIHRLAMPSLMPWLLNHLGAIQGIVSAATLSGLLDGLAFGAGLLLMARLSWVSIGRYR